MVVPCLAGLAVPAAVTARTVRLLGPRQVYREFLEAVIELLPRMRFRSPPLPRMQGEANGSAPLRLQAESLGSELVVVGESVLLAPLGSLVLRAHLVQLEPPIGRLRRDAEP